jgi:hypothetical protein
MKNELEETDEKKSTDRNIDGLFDLFFKFKDFNEMDEEGD